LQQRITMIDNEQMNDLQLEDVEDYSADYPPVGFPNAEENMAPMAGNSEDMAGYKSSKYRRSALATLVHNNKWSIAVLGVIVIVLIGVLAAAVGKDEARPSSSEAAGVPPVTHDPAGLDQDVLATFKSSLLAVYDRHNLDTTPLDDDQGDTPQRKAMHWMCTDPNVNSIEHTEKLQRYVLGVLFYATNMVPNDYAEEPSPWLKADNWITNAHSCDWMGVVCDDKKEIVSIDLERNRLSGKLPLELAIIGNKFKTLDLTSNLLHMKGMKDYDCFKSFTSMETLLMDDNYLYHKNGLPEQFRHMTNLEKLRLSYNLFEGVLESGENPVLGAMPKLTHLEIESNFISGTMPAAIGNLENLVYLYMRRNNMSYNLDFLKTGKLVDLFAMWLDSNAITGSIPTEIGLYTGLASLSLTNATLTGTIPEEMGQLTDLHRLWLYSNQLTGTIPAALGSLANLEVVELHNNKLTGQMPQGVCDSVGKAEYEYKSLTSNCISEVTCECCTECF